MSQDSGDYATKVPIPRLASSTLSLGFIYSFSLHYSEYVNSTLCSFFGLAIVICSVTKVICVVKLNFSNLVYQFDLFGFSFGRSYHRIDLKSSRYVNGVF